MNNYDKPEMNTLLTKIRYAKITTREVLIHLRKNGGLKRKQYLKYLKLQYLMAGNAYEILQSSASKVENQTEKPNTLYNKKTAMPVNLSISEMASMSKSFDEITFLEEAWHFYQREEMKKDSSRKINIYPVSNLANGSALKATGSTKQTDRLPLNNTGDCPRITNKNSFQSKPQAQETFVLTSGFDQLNQHHTNSGSDTPLCVQILKWVQEGRLSLN